MQDFFLSILRNPYVFLGFFVLFSFAYLFFPAIKGPSNKKPTRTAYDEFEAQMQKAKKSYEEKN